MVDINKRLQDKVRCLIISSVFLYKYFSNKILTLKRDLYLIYEEN